MTSVTIASNGGDKDSVELMVPATATYTPVIRMVMSGLGNAVGLKLDEIEDWKLAVVEACYPMLSTVPSDRLAVTMTPCRTNMVVTIQQTPPHDPNETKHQDAIGSALIDHLVDEVVRAPGSTRLTTTRQDSRPVWPDGW